MTLRWKQYHSDLEKAVARLMEAISADDASDLIQDALIQRFEFTFELAKNTLKSYLREKGETEVNYPKEILRKALEGKLITDGDLWMMMLEDRNKMSHVYNEDKSTEIAGRIRSGYAAALGELTQTLAEKK